ncbi:MAG: hypothetical protein IT241_11105 [Bacteroidia bacterium]|nr:hypothetical protein [Bacteroidia bacterium]
MLYSLETRIPFLDHRVVEASLNMSLHFNYREATSKFIL